MLTGSWHLWFLWKLSSEPPESGSRWGLCRERDRRQETLAEVFWALKDICSEMMNKTTNVWSITHAQTHTNTIRVQRRRTEEEDGMETKAEKRMTHDIYDQRNNLSFQRQKELWARVHRPSRSVRVHMRWMEGGTVCVCLCIYIYIFKPTEGKWQQTSALLLLSPL